MITLSTLEKILPQLPGLYDRLGVEEGRETFFIPVGVGEVQVNIGEIHWEGEYELRFDICGTLKSVHRLLWDYDGIFKQSVEGFC